MSSLPGAGSSRDDTAAQDQYVEALVKVGMDRAEAERRVADQRARGLLTEPPNPSECEYGCSDGLLYDPRAEGNVVDCPACKVSRDRAGALASDAAATVRDSGERAPDTPSAASPSWRENPGFTDQEDSWA